MAPSDPFFDFSFPSYGRFREGDPPTQQKVLPHPTVGHCLTVTALARAGLYIILCIVGKRTAREFIPRLQRTKTMLRHVENTEVLWNRNMKICVTKL